MNYENLVMGHIYCQHPGAVPLALTHRTEVNVFSNYCSSVFLAMIIAGFFVVAAATTERYQLKHWCNHRFSSPAYQNIQLLKISKKF